MLQLLLCTYLTGIQSSQMASIYVHAALYCAFISNQLHHQLFQHGLVMLTEIRMITDIQVCNGFVRDIISLL